jgi:IS605 OrfB family transposase
VEKTLPLNFLPLTDTKRKAFHETYIAFKEIASRCLSLVASDSTIRTYSTLHERTYADNRRRQIASQLVEEAQRYTWQRRKVAGEIERPTVRFDRRLFSWKTTKRGYPVLSVRCNNERLGLPIRRDGAYLRLRAHITEHWEPTSVLMTHRYRFLVLLKKNSPTLQATENVVGVDQNSNGIGVTVMNKWTGRILRQLYLGCEISLQQIRYENRRAKLQKHRDKDGHRSTAGLKLRQLSGRQRNYVRTNTWLLTKQLTDLARRYNATIAIERLYKLRRRRGQMSSMSRRKTNRIPYGFFRHALTNKAIQLGIPVTEVPAKYTSQTCPRCGYISCRNRKNWRYFKCVQCGFEANADRVASVNICRKAIQIATYPTVMTDQNLPTGVPVSVPVRQDEGVESWQQSSLQVASSRLQSRRS